jgi:hypothetical protein
VLAHELQGGGGVRCVYILLMACWHGLPIGASGVMKTMKGKKRGRDSQPYDAQGGRVRGPRPPMQEYDQAQPRPSTKPHLIGRGGEACARWHPGRENRAVMRMKPGPQRERQSENDSRTEEHGGSDEHRDFNADAAGPGGASLTGVAACHGWACKVSGPAGQSPAGRMMPASVTPQDIRELLGTMQQIGKMMGMVGGKIEVFVGPCEIPQRSPSTSVDCTESGCRY